MFLTMTLAIVPYPTSEAWETPCIKHKPQSILGLDILHGRHQAHSVVVGPWQGSLCRAWQISVRLWLAAWLNEKTWSNNARYFLSTFSAIDSVQLSTSSQRIIYQMCFTGTSILCSLSSPPPNQTLLLHALHRHVKFDVLWVDNGELDISGLQRKDSYRIALIGPL